jgi:hypothetical protein
MLVSLYILLHVLTFLSSSGNFTFLPCQVTRILKIEDVKETKLHIDQHTNNINNGLYMQPQIPDQHTNNINKGLYMQPQIHTACTTDYNVQQILLHH